MRRAATFVAMAALLSVPGCGGAGNEASTSAVRPTQHHAKLAGYERCPRRGFDALPLTAAAEESAQMIAKRQVGRSPQIAIAVRPASHAGARGHEVSFMCGPKVARRTAVVFTYDHRYDRGPNKSASLAQHAFLVSRFDDGYRLWYVEH
jgi:hypothetical protein